MIDKTKILQTVEDRLKKLPVGHYIDLRTYKRNRSVLIVKNSATEYTFIEDGYAEERFRIHSERLRKMLSILLRKEFPRSHKIRLYVMGVFTEEAKKISRKVL